jgi:hypothetical protein
MVELMPAELFKPVLCTLINSVDADEMGVLLAYKK